MKKSLVDFHPKPDNLMKARAIFSMAALAMALQAAWAGDINDSPEAAERYIQAYNGELQILPALTLDEMPKGSVEGVKAPGGFVFDIEWIENKMTRMRILSTEGGVCRIRSYAGIGSPILRKAVSECPNKAIAETKSRSRRPTTPESCFDRPKNPLPSECYDFDTGKGEIVELRGVSGNQDWTTYSERLSDRYLRTGDAARIARNVLDYQLVTGGWPKNVPMHNKLTPRERKAVLEKKNDIKTGTIDNAATFSEIKFLARMYLQTGREEYLDGVKKGIGFLLYLQYPNGGWPQCDPAKVGYWHQITFNDGAMINVMKTLRDVYEMRGLFAEIPLDDELRKKCRVAFLKGLECILKTQIVQNGKFTLWCQQHDRETLKPCIGRAFELPSICTLESADILSFLMDLDLGEYPEALARRIKQGIDGGMEWFRANGLSGIKIEHGWRRPDGIVTSRLVRVPEEDSAPMWCRYYTLEDNRPFTGTRQSTMKFDFSEMERGENMSYMWFNECGTRLEKPYKIWQEKEEKRLAAGKAHRGAKASRAQEAPAAARKERQAPREIRVGKGRDFETIQAAYDSIPEHTDEATVIYLAPGKYREKLLFAGDRANVTIIGDVKAPEKTIISWNDTPSTIGPNGKPLGTSGSATLTIKIGDFEMLGVTVENTGTPERLAATGGKEQAGQCVAMKVENDRCVFCKCRFLGWQDTLYTAGKVGETTARQYFEDCYIEGSVDFIFGSATVLFVGCRIHTLSPGWVTAGAHAYGEEFGYVFVKCVFSSADKVKTRLARPWRAYANVAFVACDFANTLMDESWDCWYKDFGRDVWRGAEYACCGGGKTKHRENVETGDIAKFRARLKDAGLEKITDIIAGDDGWHPARKTR